MTHPYSIVSRTSTFSIRTLSSRIVRVGKVRGLTSMLTSESWSTPPPKVYEFVRRYAWCRHPAPPSCINIYHHSWPSKKVGPNAAHTITITTIVFLSCSGDYWTTAVSSPYSVPHSDVAGTGSPAIAPSRPPVPVFFLGPARVSTIFFVHLENREDHVYHRREYVEQELRKHTLLAEALFHGEPARSLDQNAVIDPYAWPHATVELTGGRNNLLWHTKAGDYFPQDCSVDGVVRYSEMDKGGVMRNLLLPCRLP